MKTAISTLYFESAKDIAEELQAGYDHLQDLIGALNVEMGGMSWDHGPREEYSEFVEMLEDASGWLDNAIDIVSKTYPTKEGAA